MSDAILAGSTDYEVVLRAWNEADGSPADDLDYNTTDLQLIYRRDGAAEVVAQEGETPAPVTLASGSANHDDWGFVRLGGNRYRVCYPDAAVATGSPTPRKVTLTASAPGVTFSEVICGLTAGDPRADSVNSNVTKWNGTAVATPATAGHPVVTVKVGTGTGELNAASGKVPSTIAAGDIATDALTADALADDAVTEIAAGVVAAEKALIDGLTADADTLKLGDATEYDVTRDATHGYPTSISEAA